MSGEGYLFANSVSLAASVKAKQEKNGKIDSRRRGYLAIIPFAKDLAGTYFARFVFPQLSLRLLFVSCFLFFVF